RDDDEAFGDRPLYEDVLLLLRTVVSGLVGRRELELAVARHRVARDVADRLPGELALGLGIGRADGHDPVSGSEVLEPERHRVRALRGPSGELLADLTRANEVVLAFDRGELGARGPGRELAREELAVRHPDGLGDAALDGERVPAADRHGGGGDQAER